MRAWGMRGIVWLGILAIGWLCAGNMVSRAEMMDPISYQGKLTDASGNPVNGEVRMVFRIWYEDRTIIWTEIHDVVNVRNGLFSVTLGETTEFPEDLLRQVYPYTYWLGIQVNEDAEMAPRIPIHPVLQAYAARRADHARWADEAVNASHARNAENAETADYATRAGSADTELWTAQGAHVYRPQGGNVGIGVANPVHSLQIFKASGDAQVTVQSADGNAHLRLDNTSGNPTVEFRRGGNYSGAFGCDAVRDNMFVYHGGTIAFKNGRLGVNMHNPEHTLDVNGGIRVSGQAHGTFPRPNYDSGWLAYDPGQARVLQHNLGGNRDNYVVDVMGRMSDGTISNNKFGGGSRYAGRDWDDAGFVYYGLTTSSVTLSRATHDNIYSHLRVRIWVYN